MWDVVDFIFEGYLFFMNVLRGIWLLEVVLYYLVFDNVDEQVKLWVKLVSFFGQLW